jgi:tetratricopeptide (TPR) repeat protein
MMDVTVPVDAGQDADSRPAEVFLSYHSGDRTRVTEIKTLLGQQGVSSFFDRDHLVAGLPWPQALERALRSVRAVLVFVGSGDGGESLGLWQRREAWFALDRQAQHEGEGRSFPVIPVLLPGARPDTGFLFLNTWIDLRDPADEPAAVGAIIRALGSRGARPPQAPSITICPYRALESFREEHAALFFGREAFAGTLLRRVSERPLVALVGASGSGKSSVIQAGLIPLLRRQRPPERAWDIVVFRPGEAPFHRLAAGLVPLLEAEKDEIDRLEAAKRLGDKLCAGAIRLADAVDRLLLKSHGTDRLLIVIDQFEELFTLTPPGLRRQFVDAITGTLDRAPVTFVLALRADFYGQTIAADRSLSDHIQLGIVNLAPMTRGELRDAMVQPAAKAAIQFEAGLVDRILDHCETQPGALPLLEFALTQLWEHRAGHLITHASYDAVGEIEGAIGRRAESVFQTLDDVQQRAALSLITRLVRVAATKGIEPDTRRRIDVAGLTAVERAVLRPFVEARLLVLDGGDSGGQHSVELAHEALIQGWKRLVDWVDQQREFLLWRQRLGQSAVEWERTGRSGGALLQGPALNEALSWARTRSADLSEAEVAFIRRSGKRRFRRRSWAAVGVALAMLAVGTIPALIMLSRTGPGVAWFAARWAGPQLLFAGPPSSTAEWVRAMDIAGRLDEIGTGMLFQVGTSERLEALHVATILLADQGRTADASRLVDRALAVVGERPDLDSSWQAQLSLATILSRARREEAARQRALTALTLARREADNERRTEAIADVAGVLAQVGLKAEATKALDETRAAFTTTLAPQSRLVLGALIARALVPLGAIGEALTLLSDLPGWTLDPAFVQLLVDYGHLKEAKDLVVKSDGPIVAAIVASALVSANRPDEAREMTQVALARLNTTPMSSDSRDRARAQFHQRLLLALMSADDAARVVRTQGDSDELASLAVMLADARNPNLSAEVAQDAAVRAQMQADKRARARTLVKVAEALAISGRTEPALQIARAIDQAGMQAAALAHVAHGFATQGNTSRAGEILRDLGKILPSISDPLELSTIWRMEAITRAQLREYDAIYDGAFTNLRSNQEQVPYPADVLDVTSWVIRDAAARRNADLRNVPARWPTKGMGRYGLHWP